MRIQRKFDSEKFHDSYCLQNDLNETDGTYSTKVIEQKIQNNFISHNYKRTEQLKDSGINVRIV